MARGKQNNENKEEVSNSLGKNYKKRIYEENKSITKCWRYVIEQFKCKARTDFIQVRDNDEKYAQQKTCTEQDWFVPAHYNNDSNFKWANIKPQFDVGQYWDDKYYDPDFIDSYLQLTYQAQYYFNRSGLNIGHNKFYNSSQCYITVEPTWLYNNGYGNDLTMLFARATYDWFCCSFCVMTAMLLCETDKIKILKNKGVGTDSVSPELIEGIKKETENLIQDMGIKEPPTLFFSSSENMMCLLLTAFCIKDDMADKEKERIIKALIDHVKGEGTVNYKYREKLLKDVAKKNELLAAADTIISDYYVLPTLSKIKLKDDGRIRCKVEAPIGFGKTTFYRAIVTLMLRNHIIDERITAEKNKLDELEKKIRESWADIEFSNYFPIYINSLTINRRTEVKDLMQLAVGSEYDELIRQYAESDEGRRVMLIIDGLDEVNDFEQRQRLSELIDAFIGEYQNINYIVSTRPIDLAAYENEYDAGAFLKKIQQRVTIKELSKEQKEEIIDKWVRVLSDEVDVDKRLERIRSTIDESHYFSDLSGNPSLLAVTVQKLTVDKPPKQNEIISSIVDYLIKKKMHSRLQGQLKIPDKDIRRVLSCLAYNCITKDINAFDWAKLSTLYINAYQSVSDKIELTQKDKNVWSDSLLEINTKVGLIVFDEETQKYHWQSETLELFLAAEWALLGFQYLVDNNGENDAGTKIREQLDELRKHTRWEDIFIMMLVGWDEIYERSIFRSVIKIIIRYLLDLTITLDKKLIISIGRIILICCLESYANSYDDIVYDKDDTDKEKESILLMLRFINQNAKIIDVNGERVEECNNRAKYRVFYDELCEKGLIQFLQQSV